MKCHGRPLVVEDRDPDYGTAVLLCHEWPACTTKVTTGPSEHEIYRKEQGWG